MRRILLDQGLAPRAAEILRQFGFDAVHVADIGMARAEDMAILDFATGDARVVVTLDHDFHWQLATTGAARPSVVLLRVQGLNSMHQAELIRSVFLRCEAALEEGAAVSADGVSVRIRRLPLK